jgi:DMSO/TMAO reductase YedYZ molybdopterin-dependent catalytic subunit
MGDSLAEIRNTLARFRQRFLFVFGQSILAGLGGVLGSYALAGATPSFIAAPIGGFLSRHLPSALITFAILFLGSLGQQLNLLLAVTLATGSLAAAALVGASIERRTGQLLGGVVAAGLLAWVAATLLTGAPVTALGAGIGTGLVFAIGEFVGAVGSTYRDSEDVGRRRFLGSLVGVTGVGLFGVLGGDRLLPQPEATGEEAHSGDATRNPVPSAFAEASEEQTDIDRLLQTAEERSLGVEGIEPLVSEEFYEVDINPVNPTVDEEEWTLSVTGAVEQEVELTYEDLFGPQQEHRFATLRCVGEPLNGEEIDTALWTGIPVDSLLEQAGPSSDCECVMLRAADDYYEEFPLEALRGGLLAYGMNGAVLPRKHGFPLRALVPGHWGEINVKWLTEIELLETEQDGYWEQRGWHGTGPVETVAKLHARNQLEGGRVEVGGHAYAGTRGIETVKVSTDGGDTWAEAQLSEPLPGDDVWRQWRYEYEAPSQTHEAVVYAVDGTGQRQPRDQSGAFPDGASGWVRESVRGQ